MSPNDIADNALLTVSRWQREAFTPQMHADHLLQIYQQRRMLPPAMRLADCVDGYEARLEMVREEMESAQ